MATIYAKLMNQYCFKYQKAFPASFDKQDEDNQLLDETELIINLNINHNLTETAIGNIDNKFPLEHPIQKQEKKESGWIFDKFNSLTKNLRKTTEMNGSS